MNKLFKYLFASALVLGFIACEDDEENTTVTLQDNVERGAVLRTISFSDELLLCAGPEAFSIELEEQDIEEGALLDNVNIYVTFTDNSDIAGNTTAFNTSEVLIDNIPASEFSPGPFGLPRVSLTYTLQELVAAIGGTASEVYVGDTFLFREELILTDGRIFSSNNAGGIITAGFFNSPFQHIQTVAGGLGLEVTGVPAPNAINIASGGGSYGANVTIAEGAPNLWSDGEVFVQFVDNTVDMGDPDFTTAEMSIATFTRADFMQSVDADGNPIANTLENEFMFDFATISSGVALADMAEMDAINVRYSFNNSCGQAISSFDAPFTDVVPVISCPVAPLTDSSTFVGDYLTEQLAPTIFGYSTFGDGVVLEFFADVTDAGQVSPGVPLAPIQRAFDADYIFELGFANTQSYVASFDCQAASLVDGSAPLSGSTGLACGGGPAIFLGSAVGGMFDVDDDTEFIIALTDDVPGSCGAAGSTIASVKFTKQ